MERTPLFIALIALAVFVAGTFGVSRFFPAPGSTSTPNPTETPEPTLVWRAYESTNYEIGFKYPEYYFLDEQSRTTHYAVDLTEDTEENKAVREGQTPGREGPTAISFRIYRQPAKPYTPETWIKNVQDSEYHLSPDKVLTPRTIDGHEGFMYRWSGLYEGKSIVVARGNFIYQISVTYFTSEDPILMDFENIISTVSF